MMRCGSESRKDNGLLCNSDSNSSVRETSSGCCLHCMRNIVWIDRSQANSNHFSSILFFGVNNVFSKTF